MQELGIALLAKRGVRLLTASGDDLTESDDLGRKDDASGVREGAPGRQIARARKESSRASETLLVKNGLCIASASIALWRLSLKSDFRT